jgi:hypothetical protein
MAKIKIGLMASVIIAAQLMVSCSSMSPGDTRQWQPTEISDFRSVAGKWEGLLIRNPRTPDDDWLTLVIADNGAYEFVSYRTIGVFAGKGTLALTDGKLNVKSDKGGQMTLALYADTRSSERMLRVNARDSGGFTYTADLKRTGASRSAKRIPY